MIFDTAWMLALALLLDAALGEPKWLWRHVPHPAVLMGRAIEWCDRKYNVGFADRLSGVLVILVLAVVAINVGLILILLPLGWLWSILLGAALLAQKSLVEHVRAVANALASGLPEGRRAVAMIVGRDTAGMDESAIASAAIESAAENLSDGVVAPAFWFLIAGLPGILFYKMVNTADSMIGHKTDRYREFGWAAARLDDLLNWIPARLTALLIAAMHQGRRAWAVARGEAWQHRSPNAGWPEAAMAAVLGVAVGGPRSYGGDLVDAPYLNGPGRKSLHVQDIDAAISVLWRSWAGLVASVVVLALLGLLF